MYFMENLRIIPLDEVVVFPGMPVTLPVDVGTDTHVLLLPRHDDQYASVGVVAEVSEKMRVGRGYAVAPTPLHRALPGRGAADEAGILRVEVEERPDAVPAPDL